MNAADLLKEIVVRVFLCFLIGLWFFLTPEMAMAQVIGGQNAANFSPSYQTPTQVNGSTSLSIDKTIPSPSFSELAQSKKAGSFVVPTGYQKKVTSELGYDPSRAWPAGATPDYIIKLGDLLDNPYLHNIGQLSLREIGQLSGIELEKVPLNEISIIRELSIGDLYELYPQLKELSLKEIPFFKDTLTGLVNNPHPVKLDSSSQYLIKELAQNPALQNSSLKELTVGNWEGILNKNRQDQVKEIAQRLPNSWIELPLNQAFPIKNNQLGNWERIAESAWASGINLTGEELLNQFPLFQEIPLGVLPINNLSIASLPGLADKPLEKIPNAANKILKKIPGLDKIPINEFPLEFGLKLLTSDTFASLDIAYSGKTETPVTRVVTGGTKDQKFKPSPCKEKRCPHFELDDVIGSGTASPLSGKSWVEGKAQLVEGGKGFLRSLGDGKEPTGIPVWGTDAHVKLSLEDITEGGNGQPAKARVWANFQFCIDTFFSGEQCSPHFISVATPWEVQEGGLVVIASTGELPDFIASERSGVQQQYETQYGQGEENGEYGTEVVGDGCTDKVIAAVPSQIRGAALKSVPLILAEAQKQGLSANQTAYVLATVQTESQMGLYMYEISKGGGKHGIHYGRGYVQITHDYNYRYWSQRLGIDLIGNPDLAASPSVAVKILIGGMKDGTFTGMSPNGTYLPGAARKLSDYINSSKTDYVGARRIVNGQDKALAIARDAKRYQQALSGCSSGGIGTEGSGKCSGKLVQPTKGTLTSAYGWRRGRMHNGIDVANAIGTPMVAIDGGTIEKIYNGCATVGYYGSRCGTSGFQGYGNIVLLKLCNGFQVLYAHAQKGSIRFKPGQKVDKGQVLANMGSSGSSTGSHIHFEIRTNNGTTPENPLKYIPGY
ncbi:MAG: peptidoglycan DD-metalloendopeptidase family protein [Crocosphaera sp.]